MSQRYGLLDKPHAGDRGLTQKKQASILDDFRAGGFNVLVATQIGEEGLDIVECDEVIFYDTVPSAVRYIQRRGRTGRKGPGEAIILIAKGTRDEAYYWISQRRERQMNSALKQFMKAQEKTEPDQVRMEKFISSKVKEEKLQAQIIVLVDSRELGAIVTRELAKLGVLVRSQTLEVGDFVLSDRVVVERKDVEDFGVLDNRREALSTGGKAQGILRETNHYCRRRDTVRVRPRAAGGHDGSLCQYSS